MIKRVDAVGLLSVAGGNSYFASPNIWKSCVYLHVSIIATYVLQCSEVYPKVRELVSFSIDLDVIKPDMQLFPADDHSSPRVWAL